MRHRFLVLVHGVLALLVAGVVAASTADAQATLPGSTSPSGKALDRLRQDVTRPGPSVPPPRTPGSDMIWVPDRYVPVPGVRGDVFVPGHWERRISEHEVHVPPLTGRTQDGGAIQWPAGPQRPPHERQSP
jgi:hypothetical protein